MRKVISFFVVIMIAQLSFSQGLVKGVVVDKSTSEPLVGVTVYSSASGKGVVSTLDGSFAIKLSSNSENLTLTYVGYTSKTIQVTTTDQDFGKIELESESVGLKDLTVTSSVAIRRKTPVALSVVTPLQIENKLGTQEFPEILKSTPGVYATKQGGGYGDSRVNIRGFESANTATMINGVPMNDMENGTLYWSNWAGLADVTRSMQVQRGLGASKVAAPSLGGSVNVVTQSTDAKKGGSASYGIGNDGYEKVGFAVSTGLTANNWAITFMGSKTKGDGYIQGTQFVGYSYFLNVSKRISDAHQLSFTAFGAPQWHNQRNNSDKLLISEWQKQPLKYKYNASYGFDMNGQQKASSYNYYHKPQISLNHYWTIDEKSSLSTALYLSLGNGGGWSGQGNTLAGAAQANWYGSTSGVPNTLFRDADGTFDYAAIYAQNQASTYGSKLAMATQINKHVWTGLLSTYTTKIGQDIDIYGGLDLRYYKGTHTNEITDLYGGKFFVDNSISGSTKKLGVGDVVFRDYDGFVASEGLFGQAEYNKNGLSAFISLSGSNTSDWRYDRFYYDAANARSKTANFLGYTAKGGANYNIDEHSNVFGNIGYISRAPFFSGGVFTSSSVSNNINSKAVNEKAFSAELGYGFRSKYFTANLNAYRTKWIDKTMNKAFTTPGEIVYVNLMGVNALHQGLELDFTSKPTKDLEITGMVSLGDWKWQSNVKGYLFNSNGQPITKSGQVVAIPDSVSLNIKGIRVGNSAQTTAAIGLNYQILKGFYIGLDGNFYGRNYANYAINFSDAAVAQPWMIPNAVTFDLNAHYHFKIGEYEASLNGTVDNLLDNAYITDAADGADHTWKTAQVFYGFGRTWSTTLKIRF
jgi:hypothetical protein